MGGLGHIVAGLPAVLWCASSDGGQARPYMTSAGQVVPLDLAVERGAFDAENRGDLRLVPIGVPERLQDVPLLHVVQRLGVGVRRVPAGEQRQRSGTRRANSRRKPRLVNVPLGPD